MSDHGNHLTRLAPSPTGALHLGNARTFLINWAMARQGDWRIALRIDDLDTPRTKRGADQQAIDDLRWLGLDWNTGPTYQLTELSRYQQALAKLAERGLIYPCHCTRSEIAAAQSAPHGDEHELRYSGTCRPAAPAPCTFDPTRDAAWRLIVPDESITFNDAFCGPVESNVQQMVGDFVVGTKRGLPAYQLAVVIDDALAGVSQVVRGDDLLRSTARQLLLYRLLELGDPPAYCHLPLVIGPDGRRLAKRHGDTRIAQYRELGVPADRLIGLLAHWSIPGWPRQAMSATRFADWFDLTKLPRQQVVFSESDDQWLREGALR